MIEGGLVKMVQEGLQVDGRPSLGGFWSQLQKDQSVPGWTHRVVSQVRNNLLAPSTGIRMRRIQIDCYAGTPAACLALADAIDKILDGYQGKLPDDDATYVSSCMNADVQDFFDDPGRSFRRMLEYELWFTPAAS